MAFDWSNALAGGVTGGGIGAAGGPWGAAAGSVLGLITGGMGFGKGEDESLQWLENFDPETKALIMEALPLAKQGNQNALKYINSILSNEPGAFEDFERPALEQFQQDVIPNILERFQNAGMSKGSSGLNQTLGRAGKELSTNLAAQRANLKQSAMNSLQNYNSLALTPTRTPYKQEGKPSLWSQMGPAAGAGFNAGLQDFGSFASRKTGNFMNNFKGGI